VNQSEIPRMTKQAK